MPIQVLCKWCGKRIQAGDSFAGKTAKCPGCGGVVKFPPAQPSVGPAFPEFPEFPAAPPPPASPLGPPPGGSSPANPVFDVEDFSTPPAPVPNTEEDRRPCPACGELIMSTAVKCRFCGEVFDSSLRRTVGRGRRRDDNEDMTGFDWFLAICCPGIGCIVAIVRLIQGKKSAGKMLGVSLIFAFAWNVVSVVLKDLGNNPRRR